MNSSFQMKLEATGEGPAPVLKVLFLGCGDLGTGAAHHLFGLGFQVAVVELQAPLAVRRHAAFAEAARTGETTVEGVRCRRVPLERLAESDWPSDLVPLCTEPAVRVIAALRPDVLVDARLAKRPLEGVPTHGLFHVALGPGHRAPDECDACVETWRGEALGRVIWQGSAQADTGAPAELGGATVERVLRAPAGGVLRLSHHIGDRVRCGEVVATVDGAPVQAGIGGLVRGLLAAGDRVQAGQKLGDIDPRPDAPPVERISDKARAVGAGVARAVLERFRLEAGPSSQSP